MIEELNVQDSYFKDGIFYPPILAEPSDTNLRGLLLTQYLIETKNKMENFNTLAWIKSVDTDTLKMLEDAFWALAEDSEDEDDGDDLIYKPETENERKSIDAWVCCTLMAAYEGKEGFSYDELIECFNFVYVMVTMEVLRREGFVEIIDDGDGKIFGKQDTTYRLTKLGKERGVSLKGNFSFKGD